MFDNTRVEGGETEQLLDARVLRALDVVPSRLKPSAQWEHQPRHADREEALRIGIP